ncbi:RND superfamily permease [Natronomonas pharaonis DSM 2160]|uniref:RND superfamily permease n=1 Tax=Natronomonas pharaonis (strain ATCC 35678 / DSM 2160 / CIP 103997 / JCM 8858 / NBRC 14720 / NCIMB 2260 / Gabara) TaxID=348780 RepID=A0A1U7EW72_NATPD|nr:MMPL family transporter [Natronomonas pharaonis]CAI49322.1 RND superfamily permease [Natronomonas pharaonis DSM 2160]
MPAGSERAKTVFDTLKESIVTRPKTVVLVFLLATAAFAAGVPAVEDEDDATEGFTQDIPEQEALDAINEQFEGPFTEDTASTQLIHVGGDVLTRGELLRSLTVLERVEQREDLRMASAGGPPVSVARALDEDVTAESSMAAHRQAVENATPTEIRGAVREAAEEDESFAIQLGNDFSETEASASASMTSISHDVPQGFDDNDLADIQTTIDSIADDEPGDLRVFGTGITQSEFGEIIGDSLAIVMPIVVVLLLAFLVVAYRDPIDLMMGLFALLMTIIWTFGFMGHAGIPFDQNMISVPVLLLAVGVDFGIHIINRYREETIQGYDPVTAMRTANNQLIIAFIIVTVTTVFGFGANVVSDLDPIRNLGIVSAVGIVFTFLVFGLFLPAAKIEADRIREKYNVPEFNSTPIASEESALGRILALPSKASQNAPVVFVVVILLAGAGMGAYGSGVDTSFDNEDFLPPEEEAAYVQYIPEPFAPGEYTVTETINLLEDRFAAMEGESVTIFVEGPFEEDHALEALAEPTDDPPDSLAVGPGGAADETSIINVIDQYAERNPEFAALVDRNDRTGDGIPNRNLGMIYNELDAAPPAVSRQADQYLTDDRRGAQIEFGVDADASQGEISDDAREFSEDFRYSATATGQIVVFDVISDIIFESAIQGLVLALVLTGVFLVIAYGWLERQPLLGIVNVFPIMIAVAFLIGTMRLLDMPLNALTATILSISIGIGIAYSVHITHRFIDEFKKQEDTSDALETTLTGTGGALTGSMLTTSLGTGALAFAITPVLGDFGLLMALSVVYSFAAAIIALPPAIFTYELAMESETVVRIQNLLRDKVA